ncbi:hypothetical protein G9O61_00g004390 [Vairimorpha ceranae]|nr:hypothetical protein G9O61_00g004390 [Vairimorpha ceranae]
MRFNLSFYISTLLICLLNIYATSTEQELRELIGKRAKEMISNFQSTLETTTNDTCGEIYEKLGTLGQEETSQTAEATELQ